MISKEIRNHDFSGRRERLINLWKEYFESRKLDRNRYREEMVARQRVILQELNELS
jgi:hypothetical protein